MLMGSPGESWSKFVPDQEWVAEPLPCAGTEAPPPAQETTAPAQEALAPAQGALAPAQGASPSVFAKFKRRLGQVWHEGGWDLIVPVYTWHNRFMYDASLINKYNELTLGVGFGRSITDEDGDNHILYAMGFVDSNYHFQPFVGYGFLKKHYFNRERDIGFGGGFTLGITARKEFSYIPLPLPLPVVSLQFKSLNVEAAYVPGIYNYGNVLFTWLRWHF